MSNDFNKIVSFVLGLIVVVVFFAIISGKLKGKLPFGSKSSTTAKVSVTPTPTKAMAKNTNQKVTITYPQNSVNSTTKGGISTTQPQTNTSNSTSNTSNVSNTANTKSVAYNNQTLNTIPSTGAPTFLLPMAFSSLVGGAFLRKSKKKA